jgi:hypothetical protein
LHLADIVVGDFSMLFIFPRVKYAHCLMIMAAMRWAITVPTAFGLLRHRNHHRVVMAVV